MLNFAIGGKEFVFQHFINENEQKPGLITAAGSQKQSHYSQFPDIPQRMQKFSMEESFPPWGIPIAIGKKGGKWDVSRRKGVNRI
jgi:hypothetical protein